MNEIVVIGSTNVDMVVKTEKFPEVGETILGGKFNKYFGGKGANQAVAAARLGGNVNFICKTGDDEFGESSKRKFKKEGLETGQILTAKKAATGVALITVNSSGDNKIVVAPGANSKFSPNDILELEEVIEEARFIVLQLEIPLETIGTIIERAKNYDTKVILNPAPADMLPDEYYRDLFLITPNETETKQLTGVSVDNTDDALRASEAFHEKGVQNVVITLGAQGAFVSTDTFTGIVETPKVDAEDTTAAGDVFNGALSVALTKQKGWSEAVEYACKAAALSVTKDGAQDSAPYEIQLKEFEAEMN